MAGVSKSATACSMLWMVLIWGIVMHPQCTLALEEDGRPDSVSRVKRSCEQDKVLTMERFINYVERIENHTDVKDKSAETLANYMRTIFDETLKWNYFCGQRDKYIPSTVLTTTELDDLKYNFIKHFDRHVNDSYFEYGVALTENGDTISVGHMIVGISCGGFARDTDMSLVSIPTSYPLDNLHVVTLAGDIGQTTLKYHTNNSPAKTLLGPGGRWDSSSCPREFVLDRIPSEATKAEIMGDIDGVILGMVMPEIKEQNLKLSQILRRYYGGAGLGPGGIIKDSNRIMNYKMGVQDTYMTQQAMAFLEAYSFLLYKSTSYTKLKSKVPATMKEFYSLSYISVCDTSSREKHTIKQFIEIVKTMEGVTGHDIEKMTSSILGLVPDSKLKPYFDEFLGIDDDYEPTDGFYWQVLRDLVTHETLNEDKTKLRELGVLADFHGTNLAIGHVLAGILAGKNNDWTDNLLTKADNLYGATVAGVMARAGMKEEELHRRRGLIGPKGSWTSDCPPKYILSGTTPYVASRAELTGAIDGFILGKHNSNLKLSKLLEEYYTTGLSADISIKSTNRTDVFKSIYGGKTLLKDEISKTCQDIKFIAKTVKFSSDKCSKISSDAVTEFEWKMLSEVEVRKRSATLPDFDVLQKHYKGYLNKGGQLSSDDLKREIGGGATSTSISNTDALRISLLLNQLGHEIPKQSSGAVTGKDSKPYIYDVDVMEEYMAGRYGSPFITSSAQTLANKRGILIVETKSSGKVVGLWNGEELHQMTDFTAGPVNSLLLWQSADCKWLADKADCAFYTCVENNIIQCGDEGYAIGYAHRYCNKFVDNLHLFSDDGKQWVLNVKACLQKNLLPVARSIRHQSSGSQANCHMIKQIAFKSHPDCYTAGEPNFCDVIMNPRNWIALMAVFETGDFFGVDGKLAIDQVKETAAICMKQLKDDFHKINDALKEAVIDLGKSLYPSDTVDAESEKTTDCESYAAQGDCRFYECFEKRFPCHVHFGVSHIRDFELISCKKFVNRKTMMDSQGETWLRTSQSCLMQDLLPLYSDSSVNCASISNRMMEKRHSCFINNGFCGVLESKEDKFTFDTCTNTRGFPKTTDSESITTSLILNSLVVPLDSYYYQSAISLQRLVGPLAAECYNNGQRSTPELYSLGQSDQCHSDSCVLKSDVVND